MHAITKVGTKRAGVYICLSSLKIVLGSRKPNRAIAVLRGRIPEDKRIALAELVEVPRVGL